jgi:predicted Zn-dependent protease
LDVRLPSVRFVVLVDEERPTHFLPEAIRLEVRSLLNKVGSRVLPEFLTVTDNPQLTQADGHTLFGSYKFDEEGTPSQETVLIKDGVLKTLLTS